MRENRPSPSSRRVLSMLSGNRLRSAVALLALAVFSTSAIAVIAVPLGLSKRYAASSGVYVGKIAAVTPANRVVEVKSARALKGKLEGEVFRVQVSGPPEVIKEVEVGADVAVFVVGDKARVHVADRWMVAQARAGMVPPLWVASAIDVEPRKAFPGRSAALVGVLDELAAGKSTLLDVAENRVFKPALSELGNAGSEPAFALAADVDGDGKVDRVIGSEAGAKVFLAGDSNDAAERLGLKDARGAYAAAGDVNGDGKIDLLIGQRLWLGGGGKFTADKEPFALDAGMLAVALADVNGDGRLDVVAVYADGRAMVFANPGAGGGAWAKSQRTLWKDDEKAIAAAVGGFGDRGRAAAMVVGEGKLTMYALDRDEATPYEQLAGETPTGLKALAAGARAVAIDVNGDGRADLLVSGPGGDLLLINRGFGVFLTAVDVLKSKDAAMVEAVRSAALLGPIDLRGDAHQGLMLVGPKGQIRAIENASEKK